MRIPLTEIAVADRFRQDLGDLDDLCSSLLAYGQLQSILVDRAPDPTTGTFYRLVAGGRRIAAMTKLGWTDCEALVRDELPPATRKEMELEENVRRQDMTWQERVLAIDTIHTLRHDADPEWGMRQTAALLGFKGHSSVGHAAIVARAIRAGDEELAAQPHLRAALDLLIKRKLKDVASRLTGLNKTTTVAQRPLAATVRHAIDPDSASGADGPEPESHDPDAAAATDEAALDAALGTDTTISADGPSLSLNISIRNCDAIALLDDLAAAGQPPTYIYTDPPYAIDMDTLDQTNTGMDTGLVKATHDVTSNRSLLTRFIKSAYDRSADHAWLVFWCDHDNWTWLEAAATAAGWRVQRWPFVWVKVNHNFNQMGRSNFTKATEIAMVCSKPKATLAVTAPKNFFIYPPEKPATVTNPFFKPIALHTYVIRCLAFKGSTIIDPFCGSGSITEACIEAGYNYTGGDIDPVHLADLHRRLKL